MEHLVHSPEGRSGCLEPRFPDELDAEGAEEFPAPWFPRFTRPLRPPRPPLPFLLPLLFFIALTSGTGYGSPG